MINNILKVEQDSLIVKLIIGIKSDDQSHLNEHYDVKKQSMVFDDLFIVFNCENLIKIQGERVIIRPVDLNHAKHFDLPFFEKEMWKMISQVTRQ